MPMPRPTPEHQALAVLAGDWVGDELIHPSPFDPAGGTAVGRVRNRAALDGFAIVQDYEQERGGAVRFRGHGVFTFDVARSAHVLYWFDSFGLPPSEFRGSLRDGVLTLTATQPNGRTRARFDLTRDGRYGYRMELSQDGAAWAPFMEGEYRRT
jgi:hypothetical protein